MMGDSLEVSASAQWLVEALEGLSGSGRTYLAAGLMGRAQPSAPGSVGRVWHALAALVAAVETEQRRVVEELDPDFDDGELGGIVTDPGGIIDPKSRS
jgi:ABC-type glutathione transport system ATPase component